MWQIMGLQFDHRLERERNFCMKVVGDLTWSNYYLIKQLYYKSVKCVIGTEFSIGKLKLMDTSVQKKSHFQFMLKVAKSWGFVAVTVQQIEKTRSKYNNGDCNHEKYILNLYTGTLRVNHNLNHHSITVDKDARREVHITVLTSSKVHP